MASIDPHHHRWPAPRARKPAAGRPLLFVLILALASVAVLTLLVLGPSIELPLAVISAMAVIGLMVVGWTVAGPRL